MKRAIMAAGPQPRAYSQLGTVFLSSSNIFAHSHGVTGLQGLAQFHYSPSFRRASALQLACMAALHDRRCMQRQT